MLRLEGRLRLSIKAHGTTLDPDAIEIAMLTCPGLQDVAVVPLPGPGGAILLKAVAVAPGLSAEQLRRWFAENLPPLFQPDMIELRESLPYSPAGKLLRKHLV
jgi:long-chain acyl-CoA synthetase